MDRKVTLEHYALFARFKMENIHHTKSNQTQMMDIGSYGQSSIPKPHLIQGTTHSISSPIGVEMACPSTKLLNRYGI